MRDAAAQPERDAALQRFEGTPLRDATVDPHPDDHQPPVNAGTGLDPHGPSVVSRQAASPRTGNPPAVADPGTPDTA